MNRETSQKFLHETMGLAIAPWEKVALADKWFVDAPRPNVYVGTTLTSGGYARIISGRDDESVSRIKELNAALAVGYLHLLQEEGLLNQGHNVMYSGDIGRMPGWTELDYLLFWFPMMIGLNGNDARRVEEGVRSVIHPDMNNYRLSHSERWPHYDQLVTQYHAAVGEIAPVLNPVGQVIQLIDPQSSLGCRAEAQLGRLFNIPVSTAVIDRMDSPLLESIPDGARMRQDLGLLAQAGVEIFGVRPTNVQSSAIRLQPIQ